MKSNFKKESRLRYRAKNQNGFNAALYDFFEATDEGKDNSYSKKKIRECVQNWPTKYPCKITIISQMFECSRIYVDIEYYSRLNKFLTKLFW